jgi:triphosphoribosyl-dephospho-CoA synthase
MTANHQSRSAANSSQLSNGQLAQIACLLEVTARKPGNVHRSEDFPTLHYLDFLLSAGAIGSPLDLAQERGIGATVLAAIEATRQVVSTNTNLGIVLLLTPLAAVPRTSSLTEGIERVLETTTIADARDVYRAIRLAGPASLGRVTEQDVAAEPTVSLRDAMRLAADRDLVARQLANGFEEVMREALPMIQNALWKGHPLENAILAAHLGMLARHHDSLILRKAGRAVAEAVRQRAALVLDSGWPEDALGRRRCQEFDTFLRDRDCPLNPGTTADLVTAALFAALRDGTIKLPRPAGPSNWSGP